MKKIAVIFIAMGFFASIFASVKAEVKVPRIKRARDIVITQDKSRAIQKDPIIKHRSNSETLTALIERSKKINDLYGKVSDMPVIWEGDKKIQTGKTYRGILLNSIVSTNLASPVLVRANPGQGLPYKTHFACSGITQNNRIQTVCHRMVTPDGEFPITAQILNIDGSAGLLGEYDDGKDDLIAGAVLSDFSQGMLSAAQNRLATPFGEMRDGSVKNQVTQGLINSGATTSEILLDDMKKAVPVVTVEAGAEVLVYFMEGVQYEK
jgi:hypothetical protein